MTDTAPTRQYRPIFAAAGGKHGVDPVLLEAISRAEYPWSDSPTGALGVMQIKPTGPAGWPEALTAAAVDAGYAVGSPTELARIPAVSIYAGARIVRYWLGVYGNQADPEAAATIAYLAGKFPAPPGFTDALGTTADAYLANVQRHRQEITQEIKGDTPMSGAKILVVAGHRNTTSGDPGEVARTPALAHAYVAALRQAGHEVHYLQAEDGDGRADDTDGSLDKVGQLVAGWMAKTPGDNLLMLDLHIAANNEPPGVFAIVPDNAGLQTAIPSGRVAGDVWANNPKDVRLAHAIAAGISAKTGLPQRKCRELGVMSETETGVATEYNARLAMMAYSAPFQARAVRLVIEHGNSFAYVDRPGFAEQAAQGATEAITAEYGSGSQPAPTPEPPPAPSVKPQPVPVGSRVINGHEYVDISAVGSVKVVTTTTRYQYADPASATSGTPLKAGQTVNPSHICIGEDGKLWVELRDGWRVPAAAFIAA